MATAQKAQIVEFTLGPRKAIWNPDIDGYDGLNAMAEDPVISGSANSLKEPELFNAAVKAIRLGALRKASKTKKKVRDTSSLKLGDKEAEKSLPSSDEQAKAVMIKYNEAALIKYIEDHNDINFMQILIEDEMRGLNKANRRRDKVLKALKLKIRELEKPVI